MITIYETINTQTQTEKNRLARSDGKLVSGVRVLKQVLLERNLTLNSYAVPNYKYMFGLHRV